MRKELVVLLLSLQSSNTQAQQDLRLIHGGNPLSLHQAEQLALLPFGLQEATEPILVLRYYRLIDAFAEGVQLCRLLIEVSCLQMPLSV